MTRIPTYVKTKDFSRRLDVIISKKLIQRHLSREQIFYFPRENICLESFKEFLGQTVRMVTNCRNTVKLYVRIELQVCRRFKEYHTIFFWNVYNCYLEYFHSLVFSEFTFVTSKRKCCSAFERCHSLFSVLETCWERQEISDILF